jgi:aryl-alcohol dehydrogenase-like predicted oxidoreductase
MQTALALLETAHDSGIRHFDTARMYSAGESEILLGEFARHRRASLTIVSKAGIAPANRLARGFKKLVAALPALPVAAPRFGRFEPAQIRRSVETSLRKLRIERLDALLLHEITAAEVHDELKRLVEDFKREGKIATSGVATSIEETEALIAAHPDMCSVVQAPVEWLDKARTLPPGATLVIHSVLDRRLAQFMRRVEADAALMQELEGAGVGADAYSVGTMLLHSAISRNPGVTLFSTRRPERIRHNTALVSAPPETGKLQAFERIFAGAQHAAAS